MDTQQTQECSALTRERQRMVWHSEAGRAGLSLTVIAGADFGRVFFLDKSAMVLGRGAQADIQLNDQQVSRQHVQITCFTSSTRLHELPRTMITDLHSTNGLFINGRRASEHALSHGDKVQVGETILKFEAQDDLDVAYHEQLWQQARCDPLTGLANRHDLQRELSTCLSLSARYHHVFAVMMLDIDGFKTVNDTYGHAVGDNVLKRIADMLRSNKRAHDIAARFGGEEFVMLLPETALSGAVIVAERIRMAIERWNFYPLGCQQAITISIGLSAFPLHGMDPTALVRRADEALYEAKTTGRNRVCTARMRPGP